MKRGRLLAFEGLDGCGKSTQARGLATHLRGLGHEVVTTYEPTDGPTGRHIRQMARSGEALAPEEELRWFVADRRDHVERVIEPALAAGRHVLTDRYFLSTVAYQGARGLDATALLAESEREFPLPDLVLLLEIDPARGLERVRARGGVAEAVFEQQAYLERVAGIFAALDRDYIERIDADGEPAEVQARIRDCVSRRLDL